MHIYVLIISAISDNNMHHSDRLRHYIIAVNGSRKCGKIKPEILYPELALYIQWWK